MQRQVLPKVVVIKRVVLSALVLIAPAFADHSSDTVHLYNWEAYLSPTVKNDFKSKHNITIEEFFFSDEAVRDELLLSERGRTIDLVVVESVRLQMLAKQGAIQNISSIQNRIANRFEKRWLDACGEYGIPYSWGTSGILYRSDKTQNPVTSWASLLNPDDALRNKISMYYHPIDLIGAAMMFLKHDPFSDNEEKLHDAYQLLEQQRPFLSSTEYILEAIQEPKKLDNIYMAFGFSGDEYVLNQLSDSDEVQWKYVVPEEGTVVWLECLAVPAGRPVSKATIKAIDYLSYPEVAALNAEESWFSSPNLNVAPYLSEEYLSDPIINPDPTLIERSYIYRPISDVGLRLRQRIVEDLR
ncbi:ABC transporter substrate-binding protein [Vibrio barjaei]|uniref:ABC transporter substrate-binding protein n=1 Tax=Vibrio barjaei TaxID=1676683 RepID=UPI0007BB73DE|nr:spermidine/putrescine ABC transporter substrate-binding protein [Vibrio barjaei]OIN24189.1 hypothetical protein AWH66_2003500 [Vibrio barjaei]